jgi:hypothetical protein
MFATTIIKDLLTNFITKYLFVINLNITTVYNDVKQGGCLPFVRSASEPWVCKTKWSVKRDRSKAAWVLQNQVACDKRGGEE